VYGWIPPSFGQTDTSLVANQEEAFVTLVGDSGAGRESKAGLAAEPGCGQDTAGYHFPGMTETFINTQVAFGSHTLRLYTTRL